MSFNLPKCINSEDIIYYVPLLDELILKFYKITLPKVIDSKKYHFYVLIINDSKPLNTNSKCIGIIINCSIWSKAFLDWLYDFKGFKGFTQGWHPT